MSESIEGTMFASVPVWPTIIRDVSVEEAIAIEAGIMAHIDSVRSASFDHIIASGETLVAIARHVSGPEAAERLKAEIEALESEEKGEG